MTLPNWSGWGPLSKADSILPIVDSSLKLHVKAFGDGYDKSDLVNVDGSDFVSQWTGINGTNRNAIQATPDSKPLYVSGALNGKPGLRFSNNDFFTYDGTFLVGTDYTVFIIAQRSNSKNENYHLGSNVTVDNGNLILGYRNNGALTHAQYNNDYNIGVPAYTSPIAEIHTYTHNSVTGKKMYINGVLSGSDANTAALVSYNGAQIGRALSNKLFIGDMGEIIIYDRTLLDSERDLVTDTYLLPNWGI